ncbi:MAG TPA: Glu/Leu/Phe/Val dehydrogenase, partial [Thermodesulfobacteriota bacterium]|nr:Glu/Leu/Phe/Val dehydrogenase [Thermodesulfobacteriota bacterium]
RLTRRYAYEIAILISPETDIPAPDVYTDEQTMAWIMDTYSMMKGYPVPGIVTGKPVSLGGSLGRTKATSSGLVTTVLAALKHLNMPLEGLSVTILGFGKVGYHAAKILYDKGARIIGLSDSKGAIYNSRGFDINAVAAHKSSTGALKGFKDGEDLSVDELLAVECDCLIPAALEGQINAKNVGAIKTRIMAEGANNPATLEADEVLKDKGVFLLPGVLANAGGVVVSYFEWVQDLQRFFWNESEIDSRLQSIMEKAFKEVLDISIAKKVDMRTAATVLGVKRVAEAVMIRGLYP